MSANLLTQKEFINNVINFSEPLNNGKGESHYVNNGTVLYKYKDIGYDTYNDYCKSLLKSGYSQIKYNHSEYDVTAFLKDNNLIFIYYLEKEKLLRIIYEPNAILPDKTLLENGSCELYQLSLDQKEICLLYTSPSPRD